MPRSDDERLYAGRMTTAGLPSGQPVRGQTVLLPVPPPGGFTAADLPRLIEVVDARFEILDGEVLFMPSPTHWHDEVVEILKRALRQVAPPDAVAVREKGIDLGSTVP